VGVRASCVHQRGILGKSNWLPISDQKFTSSQIRKDREKGNQGSGENSILKIKRLEIYQGQCSPFFELQI